ncbi:uncharacterized protein B0H64DRAFT_171468 [Chaetomium fimeti]|uniref:C2H2-type domain-containing protein n=1 Tax=Chaetomium fimeti TaxID=1854472 RepID=A0AAE0LT27_9PEZI|nr:hypothetical protein B0H64DRAFT_171468 [Chaetomium fimeti]
MGLTTILRGFKIPVAILDRFLEANNVEPTYGYPPFYSQSELDPASKFLRAKVDAVASQTKTQMFIPQKEGEIQSTYAYIAYAWVVAYAQRQIDLPKDLPDRAPPGFADLRREILGYANDGDEEALQVKRLEEEQEDPTIALFIVMTERDFPLRLYPRKSDMRCDRCDETNFEDWPQRNAHRKEVHGCVNSDLPEF